MKLWNPRNNKSLATWHAHDNCAYCCRWNPHERDVVATVGGDSKLNIWDIRDGNPTLSIPTHYDETLTCDWNKYNSNIIATGSVDRNIKVWDLRQPKRPLRTLMGHGYSVKSVEWSPFSETLLASISLDMTSILWNTTADEVMVNRFEHHTDLGCHVAFSLFDKNSIATCGWDGLYILPLKY